MSMFARTTFSAASYAAFRPSYPPFVFRAVLDYHRSHANAGFDTVLDLGCGHGLIARELAPHFQRVVGLDPSAGMVRQAADMTAQLADSTDKKLDHVSFRQGSAEDLSFLADESVDLVVAGQAAHWFDYTRTWPELARVVRKDGSLAFWGYKDNILIGHPMASNIFHRFCYGEEEVAPGMESLERYWEKPGRDILRESFKRVVPPAAEWGEVRRIAYDPDRRGATVGGEGEEDGAWLRKRLRLGAFEGYVRTFSSYRGWKDAHPERVGRALGGKGQEDIVDVLFDELRESVPEWKAMGDHWREAEFDSIWGTAMLLARRL